MIATVWRFHVHSESAKAFERIYGPHGDWARLFARAEGYSGTELLRLDGDELVYLTIDRWYSASDYERAKLDLDSEIGELDLRCEDYTSEETWLGIHTVLG
ncbi:MAG: hypothetical protein ABIO49_11285 [Dokdonella sp.]